MADDFVITGTRPPSVVGQRPNTASSKDFNYYTKYSHSRVDDTLFQSHYSSPLNAPVTFAAPWDGKPKRLATGKPVDTKIKPKTKPSPPLFWAPDSTGTRFSISNPKTSASQDANDSIDSSSTFGTIQGIPLKHQYRHLKHTPTFVDETLFGKPLMEPTFKAPWEEKRKVRKYNWYQAQEEERKPVRKRRPATALGVHGYSASGSAVPIWKP